MKRRSSQGQRQRPKGHPKPQLIEQRWTHHPFCSTIFQTDFWLLEALSFWNVNGAVCHPAMLLPPLGLWAFNVLVYPPCSHGKGYRDPPLSLGHQCFGSDLVLLGHHLYMDLLKSSPYFCIDLSDKLIMTLKLTATAQGGTPFCTNQCILYSPGFPTCGFPSCHHLDAAVKPHFLIPHAPTNTFATLLWLQLIINPTLDSQDPALLSPFGRDVKSQSISLHQIEFHFLELSSPPMLQCHMQNGGVLSPAGP